jgi:hypothetical protein
MPAITVMPWRSSWRMMISAPFIVGMGCSSWVGVGKKKPLPAGAGRGGISLCRNFPLRRPDGLADHDHHADKRK